MKNEYKAKIEKVIVRPEEDLLVVGESKGYITIVKDQGRITYNATGKSYSFKDAEEAIRAQVYVELIERYKYPADRIDTEIEPPRREPKLPADIVVYEKTRNKCFIVVEAKEEETEKKIEEAKREGLGNATLLDAQYLLLACGSLRLAYDVYEKPPLEELEKHRIANIPVAYGKEPEFKYKKGDPQWDLQTANFNELQHKFQLCHDEIWEGGKRDPAIAFDEMSKLMFTKIFDERVTKNGEYYRFQIGTHEEQRNITRRIKEVYAEVQDKEPDVFKGEIELPDRLVYRLVEILQDLSFSRTDLDVKGRAFEKFLGMLFRGKFGQYFTRREIVEFMVDMLSPTKDDMCLDPACGSGGFLLYAMDRVRKNAEVDYAGDRRAIDEIYWYFPIQNIFGIEINDRIARIAMMDMVIHEDGHTNIENNDSLADSKIFNPKRDIRLGKYTFLLTNPPFGAKVKDEEVFKQYELGSRQKKRKSQRSEILFIERCLDFLRPEGRMGIVLPDGILTNSSLQYVRDFIERKAKILAVISMPQTAFVPVGAGVKASLLFLQKKRFDGEEIGNYPIFMSIAEHIGYDATSRPDKNELPEILGEYKQFLQGKREFNPAFVVDKKQLEGRFDPHYYQPKFQELEDRIENGKYPVLELHEITDLIYRYPTFYGLRYLDSGVRVLKGENINGNGEIVLLQKESFISEEDSKPFAKTILKEGDLVFAVRGTVGKVGFVSKELAGSNINANLIRISLRSSVNPKYIWIFLNSSIGQQLIIRKISGAVQQTITVPDIVSIKIPLPPREIQDEIANIMDEVYKQRREKFAKAKEILNSIEPYLLEQLGIKAPKITETKSFAIMLSNLKKGKRNDPFYHQPRYLEASNALEAGKYELKQLGEIIKYSKRGIEVGSKMYRPKGIPFLRVENIEENRINLEAHPKYIREEMFENLKTYQPQIGEILFTKDGTIGRAVKVLSETKAIVSSGILRIAIKDEINSDYVASILNSSLVRLEAERNSIGAIIKHLAPNEVERIKIPVPPPKVQSQIAEEVKRRRKEAEQLRSQADKVVEEAKKKVEQMILGTKY